MSRPSDGMTLDELREEFDWISDFQSRMAERIRGDADVHNLVDYVTKLESENAGLRKRITEIESTNKELSLCNDAYLRFGQLISTDNDHLQELVDYMTPIALYAASERERDRMRELGAEVGP